MPFDDDRARMRRYFQDAWRKHQAGQPMEPLEHVITAVVGQHPEYHRLLTDAGLERDFSPESGETNPFLHMGMHIAIQEQLGGDRPAGTRALYPLLCQRFGDPHEAEHAMMECLGEILWEAQRAGTLPDEERYLRGLHRLLGSA